MKEGGDRELNKFQKYISYGYNSIYDSIVFTNYYEILDGGFLDLMIGSILTISSESYGDYFESGEKIGYACAWITILLVIWMTIFEVYTVVTFRRLQKEIDSLIYLEPVA